jgi:hypothetical protein
MSPIKKFLNQIFLKFINFFLYFRFFKHVLLFRRKVGYFPNIANPNRYQEKILWRKIFDHNPMFVTFCDKLATKIYINKKCPGLKIAPNLWSEHELNLAQRRTPGADQVIKINNGCNTNFFTNESDVAQYAQKISKWYTKDHGKKRLEWAYGQVKKAVFAEKLIKTNMRCGLIEINVRCADGNAILCSIILNNKKTDMAYGYFNTRGERVDKNDNNLRAERLQDLFITPAVFSEIISYAERLSLGIDYARYDFIYNGDSIYAGEITVYPSSGLSPADTEIDNVISCNWDIRRSWFLTRQQFGWRRAYAFCLKQVLSTV